MLKPKSDTFHASLCATAPNCVISYIWLHFVFLVQHFTAIAILNCVVVQPEYQSSLNSQGMLLCRKVSSLRVLTVAW